MKLIEETLQLVIKTEIEVAELSDILQQSLIHVGLGHSVFNVTNVSKDEVDALLSGFGPEKYYFRKSFAEDLAQSTGKSRSYLTHDARFFKPKINNDILYFLGLNFIIIEIEELEYSEKFKVYNYHCVIKKVTVNAVNGEIDEEVIWDKTKYGRIENYLPTKLSKLSSPVYQCRRRLLMQKEK